MRRIGISLGMSLAMVGFGAASILDDILAENGLVSDTGLSYADGNTFSGNDLSGYGDGFGQGFNDFSSFNDKFGQAVDPVVPQTPVNPKSESSSSIIDNILKRANQIQPSSSNIDSLISKKGSEQPNNDSLPNQQPSTKDFLTSILQQATSQAQPSPKTQSSPKPQPQTQNKIADTFSSSSQNNLSETSSAGFSFGNGFDTPVPTRSSFVDSVLQHALSEAKTSPKGNLRVGDGGEQQKQGTEATVTDPAGQRLRQILNQQQTTQQTTQDPQIDQSSPEPAKSDFLNSVLERATNEANPSFGATTLSQKFGN